MTRSVWIFCALAFSNLACARQSPSKQAVSASSENSNATGIDTSEPFAVMRVDDSFDPFAKIDDDQIPFGSGVGILRENVPLGPKRFGVNHFARLIPRPGESWQSNASRYLSWTNHAMSLPTGERFGFEDVSNYDEDTKVTTVIGLRTYLLNGDAIVTHRDVVSANVMEDDEDVPEIFITLKLGVAGSRNLEAATTELVGRRLAILSDGKINSGPYVKVPITSGEIPIMVGPHSDANAERAKKIVEEILRK